MGSSSPRARIGGGVLWIMVAGMVAVQGVKWLRDHADGAGAVFTGFLGHAPNLISAATLAGGLVFLALVLAARAATTFHRAVEPVAAIPEHEIP